MLMPHFSLLICYEEVLANIRSWIVALRNEVLLYSNNVDKSFHVFKDCHALIAGFEMAARHFSPVLFFVIVNMLGGLVSIVYRLLAFFLGNYVIDLPFGMLMGAHISLGVFIITILYRMNLSSHLAIEKLRELTSQLKMLPIKDDVIDNISESNGVSAMEDRQSLMHQLDEMKGLDGLGFFHLGKPLLTSISANFVTYLIVLIQFKITEVSSASN